jgi:hypothetical protein
MAKAAFVGAPVPYPVIPLPPVIPARRFLTAKLVKRESIFLGGGKGALTETLKLAPFAACSVGETAL